MKRPLYQVSMETESPALGGVSAPPPPPRWRFDLSEWILVIAWSFILFALSTSVFSAANTASIIEPVLRWMFPTLSNMRIDILHNLIRKLAHFTNYAILFWVMIRRPMAGRPYAALGLCVLYAMTDEFHQIFSGARGPSLYDVALDSSGALFSRFLYAAITGQF